MKKGFLIFGLVLMFVGLVLLTPSYGAGPGKSPQAPFFDFFSSDASDRQAPG